MAASFGPCAAWDPLWPCDVSTYSPTATGYAAEAATEIVWALSGRQFGMCEVTLRPCRKDCFDELWWGRVGGTWTGAADWWGTGYFGPYGYWFEPGCGTCNNGCYCQEISEVALPAPVSRIVSVKVDGSPMATGAYRVDNNRLLVRTDGARWPRCNNLGLDDTQPGTWSVTVQVGQEVPTAGRLAVGEMACEILKAMDGQDCRMPAGVTSLVRQGVSINFPDVGELFSTKGRTGLYLVDAFITTVNPNRLKGRSRVYSVDHMAPRRAGT